MTSYKFVYAILIALLMLGLLVSAFGEDEKFSENKFKAEDANFSLSESVSVTDNLVRLKHLTTHQFSNSTYAEMLICRKPPIDRPVTLTKSYLEKLFKSNGMDEKILYLMEIPKEITVACGAVAFDKKNKVFASKASLTKESEKAGTIIEIDSSEILLVVSSCVEGQLRKNDPQISIYHPTSNSNWQVAVPEDYDLKVLPGVIIRSNNVTAKIGVYHKGALIDAKLFNFKADIFVKSFAAENNFEKGKVIKKGDFTLKLVPYSLDAMCAVRDEKSLIGFELQKSIRVGETVEASELNTPILINRGAAVNIVIKEKGYSIRAVGVAQETGRIGDQIQVSMKSTNTKLNCTVTGENTVDIIN